MSADVRISYRYAQRWAALIIIGGGVPDNGSPILLKNDDIANGGSYLPITNYLF